MSDVDINIDIEKEDVQDIVEEQVTEEVTADDEVDAAEEEVEEAEQTTEMCLNAVRELSAVYNHIERYGVDRTLMRLYGEDLQALTGNRLPATESFSASGTPYDAYSIMAIEGIGDKIKSLGTAIKNGFKRMGKGISNLWDKLLAAVGVLNKKIVVAERRLAKLEDDPEKLASSEKQAVSYATISAEYKRAMNESKKVDSMLKKMIDVLGKQKPDAIAANKIIEEAAAMRKRIKEDYNDAKITKLDKVDVKNISFGDISKLITLAKDCVSNITSLKQLANQAIVTAARIDQTNTVNIINDANNNAAVGRDIWLDPTALLGNILFISKSFASIHGYLSKLGKLAIRTANARMSAGSRKPLPAAEE